MKLEQEDSFIKLMCGDNKACYELVTIPNQRNGTPQLHKCVQQFEMEGRIEEKEGRSTNLLASRISFIHRRDNLVLELLQTSDAVAP